MKDDESISNGFIIFALNFESRENMGGNGYQLASGTISGVQEMRFRLITEDGKGLLLTLGHIIGKSAHLIGLWAGLLIWSNKLVMKPLSISSRMGHYFSFPYLFFPSSRSQPFTFAKYLTWGMNLT